MDTNEKRVHDDRLELDRRVFALREAAEGQRFNFDKEDDRPMYEKVTEAAMYYYDFLCRPPIIPPSPPMANPDPDGNWGDVDNGS